MEKKEAEDALAEAMPALEAAKLALQDLDKSDVTEVRYDHANELLDLIFRAFLIASWLFLAKWKQYIKMIKNRTTQPLPQNTNSFLYHY